MIVQDPSKNSLELSRKEALQLDLRLNISEYGNLWSELGDTYIIMQSINLLQK